MMHNLRVLHLLIVVCVVISCRSDFRYPITAERISDRIISYVCLDTRVTAIKSDRGLIIIDTHNCPAIMSEIKSRIEDDFKCSMYRYVINTHGHWDHASGNQVFPDSILVGHVKCPAFMECNPANQMTTLWYIEGKLQDVKNKPDRTADDEAKIRIREIILHDLENNYRVTPPRILFTDSLILDEGDMTVRLFYCGNAHTNNDIVIYIPEERVVHTGDLINAPGSYSFSMHKLNDIPRIIDVLDRIAGKDSRVEYVIPAHSSVMSKDDLVAVKELLEQEYNTFKDTQSAVVVLKELMATHGVLDAASKFEEFKVENKTGYYYMEEEFMTLGLQLSWEKRDSAAISVLKLGLAEFPGSALLCYDLANIYLNLGNIDSAIHYYEKSLEIFPDNRNASAILSRISDD